jgi:hypothetical protein
MGRSSTALRSARFAHRRATVSTLVLTLVAALGVFSTVPAYGAGSGASPTPSWVNGFWHHQGPNGERDVNVCSYSVSVGTAHCNAHIVTNFGKDALAAAPSQPSSSTCTSSDNNVPSGVSTSGTGAYDPCYLDSAYNVASAAATHGGGVGQIVAIVDAYSDPNVTANLASYRSFFGLSTCPTGTVTHGASTCIFDVVNQNGSSTSLPAGNSGWGEEISLDVEMVSAICQNCQIALVEASSSSMANLGTGVNTAVAMGANVVSNSYGGSEYSSEVNDSNAYFNHPGVAIVAATGDNGFGVEFPAASPTVTAVGGTSLLQSTDTGARAANATETVWSGAGAGCSAYEPKPSWQSDPGCAKRMVADVSAIADPNTGVWVYDTYGTGFTWGAFGGTSVATPIISSMYALAGNSLGAATTPASYTYANQSSLYKVTSGTDGSCSTLYYCNAADSVSGTGYNGPTGLGTPGATGSIAAFSAVAAPVTKPGAPALTSASAGNGAVTLAWNAPTSNGGSAILGYNVFEGSSPGAESTTPLNGSTLIAGTSDALSGLTNGTAYYFTVQAVNGVGSSASSNELSSTPSAPTASNAPTLTSAAAGNGAVTLTWSAPASNGGSAIQGYNVFVGTGAGLESTTATNTSLIAGTSDTLGGLTNGTTYFFTVQAVNGVGSSVSSNERSATPVAVTAPSSPTLTTATGGSASVTLTWNAPSSNGGSAVQGYNVFVGLTSSGESATPSNSTLVTGTTYTVTGLASATKYWFTVKALNAIGPSTASNELSATTSTLTVPGAPTLTSAQPGRRQVTLTYSAPSNNGGSSITGYYIYIGTSAGGVSSTPLNTTPINSTRVTVTGTTKGVTYYFIVRAANKNGTGAPSNELSATSQ